MGYCPGGFPLCSKTEHALSRGSLAPCLPAQVAHRHLLPLQRRSRRRFAQLLRERHQALPGERRILAKVNSVTVKLATVLRKRFTGSLLSAQANITLNFGKDFRRDTVEVVGRGAPGAFLLTVGHDYEMYKRGAQTFLDEKKVGPDAGDFLRTVLKKFYLPRVKDTRQRGQIFVELVQPCRCNQNENGKQLKRSDPHTRFTASCRRTTRGTRVRTSTCGTATATRGTTTSTSTPQPTASTLCRPSR